METVSPPIFAPVYSGVEDVQLNDVAETCVNAYVSELGAAVKFPGLASWLTIDATPPSSIDGLYWWNEQKCVIAVSRGNVYKVTLSGNVPSYTVISGSSYLYENIRPSFATDGTYVFIANGRRIWYTDGSTLAYITSEGCPANIDSIAYLDGYLIGVDKDTEAFYLSGYKNSLVWDGTVAQAVGAPDNIKVVRAFGRQLIFFGETSTEIWDNDGQSPFSPNVGGFIDTGIAARASVIQTEDALYWLDSKRRFVRISGGSLQVISCPYTKLIREFDTVADCMGDYAEIAGKPFLFWQFPAEGKTYCLNLARDPFDWSERATWHPDSYTFKQWIGGVHCYCPDWGIHLVGSNRTATIYQMKEEAYDDGGEEIRVLRRSGHADLGTSKNKRSFQLRFRISQGRVDIGRTPKLMVRFRDDKNRWTRLREIPLGLIGNRELVKAINSAGIFRTRQYEFSISDAVPFTLFGAEEDVEVLR